MSRAGVSVAFVDHGRSDGRCPAGASVVRTPAEPGSPCGRVRWQRRPM